MISFPWDNASKTVQDRNVGSEVLADYLHKLAGSKSGIFEPLGNKGLVRSKAGMDLTVEAVDGEITGVIFDEVTQRTLTVSPSSDLPRWDAVAVRRDKATRIVEFYIIEGTPATNPIKPQPDRLGDKFDIILAYVYVDEFASEIQQLNITDVRLDSTVCGVIAAINQIDTTDLYLQYQASLDTFLDTVAQALDETLAGNLQNQITDLKIGLDETLTIAGWSGTAPFEQIIQIEGLSDFDKPIIEVIYQATTKEEQEAEITEWGKVALNPESILNGVKFKCYEEKPTQPLHVRIRGA